MEYFRAEVTDKEYPVYVPWTPFRLPDGSDPNGYEPGKEEWCEVCKKCQCVECQLNCTSPKLWVTLYRRRTMPFDNCCRIACCAVAKLNNDRLQAENPSAFGLPKGRVMPAEMSRLWRAFKYVTCSVCRVPWARGNTPGSSRPVGYCSEKCFGNAFVENCQCVNWERLKMSRRYVAKGNSTDSLTETVIQNNNYFSTA